jgi:hypothetical protein
MKSSLTLVDSAVIQTRWTEAIGKELPKLTHEMTLKDGNYLIVDIANCKTVLATIPLMECLNLPGITDGKLFRPNVQIGWFAGWLAKRRQVIIRRLRRGCVELRTSVR